jgi:5-methylcytosine-specific restriction protein A
MTPIRLCLERLPNGRGCPQPATGRGRCDEHRKQLERERSRARREATKGVYKTKLWAMRRRQVLARDPICKVCDKALSTEVDHIVPLTDGGDPYRLDGLQGICTDCHQAKTAAENARRGRGTVAT